ncbi:monovalent cation/H+ antiporter complex subunit F [Niveibacterium sp. 24ML]|uniref:monovalent cation/H+ antiporter complex subunit F n=1 Tax=Niveibacterium sp. 24ML TaxID=2985512 RepID=UPI0022705775|nr:monovalent cation/H+ antiporter complex subunit F [Niveibacterium sp. 24ML]MCX9157976.1 monovalent cation/H+ antiporter complex subunit F [Niveibacterium sp. 24ML]
MTETVLPFAILAYLLALLLCGVRLLRGPSAEDRVLALDTLYVVALALIAALSIALGHPFNFEGVLAIAMLGFVGTVAAALYLLRVKGGSNADVG